MVGLMTTMCGSRQFLPVTLAIGRAEQNLVAEYVVHKRERQLGAISRWRRLSSQNA